MPCTHRRCLSGIPAAVNRAGVSFKYAQDLRSRSCPKLAATITHVVDGVLLDDGRSGRPPDWRYLTS